MKTNLSKTIKLKYLKKNNLQQFQHFISEHWSSKHLFANETSVFNWQHSNKECYNFVLALKDNKIIGAQGFIPISHFDNNINNNQIFLALWVAEPKNGIGVGLRLFKKITDDYRPTFIGVIGINDRVIPFHKWQGFNIDKMTHSVAVSPFINKFKIAKLPKYFKIIPGNINNNVTYNKIGKEVLEQLEVKDIFDYQIPTKSIRYIINRYLKHPYYKYNIYALYKNNTLISILITRNISYHNRIVIRIVDYIGSNKSLQSAYILFRDLLKKYNAEYIDLYSCGIPDDVLERAGLIVRQNVDGLVIPNYFEPFVRENIELTYGYLVNENEYPIRMFKGDGDQDRPSKIKRIIN